MHCRSKGRRTVLALKSDVENNIKSFQEETGVQFLSAMPSSWSVSGQFHSLPVGGKNRKD